MAAGLPVKRHGTLRRGFVALLVLAAARAPADGQEIRIYEDAVLPGAEAASLAYSSDGRMVAVGGRRGAVTLYDIEAARAIQRHELDGGRVVGLAFHPDGTRLYAATEARWLAVIDLVSREVAAAERVGQRIAGMDLSPDGAFVVWGGGRGVVEVRTSSLQLHEELRAPNLYGKTIAGVRFGRAGREVLAYSADGHMAFWELGRPEPLSTASLVRQEIEAVAVDRPGDRVLLAIKELRLERSATGAIVANAYRTLRLLDWTRGGRVDREIPHDARIAAAAFTPDGAAAVAITAAGPVELIDLDTGRSSLLATVPDGVAVGVSPDGRWLAAGARDGMSTWRVSGMAPAPGTATTPAAVAAARVGDPLVEGRIEIVEPAAWRSGARAIGVQPRQSLRIVGRAFHPSGVGHVSLNGASAVVTETAGGEVVFTGYVRITDDVTEVEIEARPVRGPPIRSRHPVTSVALGERAADRVPWAGARPGDEAERWAVVIGISQYQDPDIPSLRFADADATAFYRFLTSEAAGLGGFKEENIRLLLDEQATYRNMRSAYRDFLRNATSRDVVIIYFAGHGLPDPDRPDDLYLAAYDTEWGRIASTGYPMEDVRDAIGATDAATIIAITDACHSAGVAGPGRRSTGLNAINQAFLAQMTSSSGVVVSFTASQVNQLSVEGEEWGGGHGVFTYHLLEALRGAADEDGDGIVTLGEMMEWTRDRVRRATRNAQIPTISQTAFDWYWPMSVVSEEVR